MKKTIAAFLAAAFMTGCRAHMVETHGDQVQLFAAGQVQEGRGGVIRFLANGPGSFKRARRADAEKQMRKFCSDNYTVVEEGPRSKFGSSMPIGGKASFEMDEYWYIRFRCAEKK